jgi:hypothetical protein
LHQQTTTPQQPLTATYCGSCYGLAWCWIHRGGLVRTESV